MRSKLFALILILAAFLSLGCGSSGGGDASIAQGSNPNPNPQPTGTPTPQAPNLRVINMFGASSGLALEIDGATIDADFQLAETTPYIELDVAVHSVTLVQGGETVFSQQVTLAENDFKTLVIQGNTAVVPFRDAAESVRAQATEQLTGLLLTDNTAPIAGQLQARLVNSTPEQEFVVSLLTNNQDLLLGPVGAFRATNYSVQDQNALQSAAALVLFFESSSETQTFLFNTVQGGGSDLTGALGSMISTSGINITVLTTYDTTGTQYLFIVVDDAVGNTSILSTSDQAIEI
jgi:hypothetical protein